MKLMWTWLLILCLASGCKTLDSSKNKLQKYDYYPGGNIKYAVPVVIVNGQEFYDGAYREYFSNADLYKSFEFKMGIPHGTWVEYHGNSQIRWQGNYTEGKKSGKWEYFTPEGTIQFTMYFSDQGRLKKMIRYDEIGRKRSLETYLSNGSVKKENLQNKWNPFQSKVILEKPDPRIKR